MLHKFFARLGGAALAVLLLATPALAGSSVAKLTITTAQSLQAGAGNCAGASATCALTQIQVMVPGGGSAHSLSVQCNFTYGSGGTTADAWLQTSIDGGATWADLAECSFTTASARKQFNISGYTAVLAARTPTDGTLAANTANDGFFGNWFRVKYTTVGTYAGGTTLVIDLDPTGGRLQ